MTLTFTTRLRVRHYELNARNELPNSALFRIFQETAMRATQDAGFGVEWFAERHTVWLVYQMTVEHLRPIHYPNELEVTTWLSDAQKVRTHREYLARNVATGEIVARGRAYWVHLNGATMLPARIPPELIARFQPNGVRAVSRVEPRAYPAPSVPIEYRAHRRVQRYEADGMQHVNNAVYVDWLEETLADAVAARPEQSATESKGARLYVRRHDIEYARSAVPGDEVEIVARLIGAGRCASAWELEIKRGDESLVRDHVTALWVDDAGKPMRGNW
ncbi:MAG: thioesterase [Anaerolineales bacterium]|nr:thioesterase [Anaerolineales bacterium]